MPRFTKNFCNKIGKGNPYTWKDGLFIERGLVFNQLRTGGRPTKQISIEFEIRWKFKTLLCKICGADHNHILHTSRQCNCHDVCKISLWSVECIRNYSVLNFHRISNSIEICLVGQAPGLQTSSNNFIRMTLNFFTHCESRCWFDVESKPRSLCVFLVWVVGWKVIKYFHTKSYGGHCWGYSLDAH